MEKNRENFKNRKLVYVIAAIAIVVLASVAIFLQCTSKSTWVATNNISDSESKTERREREDVQATIANDRRFKDGKRIFGNVLVTIDEGDIIKSGSDSIVEESYLLSAIPASDGDDYYVLSDGQLLFYKPESNDSLLFEARPTQNQEEDLKTSVRPYKSTVGAKDLQGKIGVSGCDVRLTIKTDLKTNEERWELSKEEGQPISLERDRIGKNKTLCIEPHEAEILGMLLSSELQQGRVVFRLPEEDLDLTDTSAGEFVENALGDFVDPSRYFVEGFFKTNDDGIVCLYGLRLGGEAGLFIDIDADGNFILKDTTSAGAYDSDNVAIFTDGDNYEGVTKIVIPSKTKALLMAEDRISAETYRFGEESRGWIFNPHYCTNTDLIKEGIIREQGIATVVQK